MGSALDDGSVQEGDGEVAAGIDGGLAGELPGLRAL